MTIIIFIWLSLISSFLIIREFLDDNIWLPIVFINKDGLWVGMKWSKSHIAWKIFPFWK